MTSSQPKGESSPALALTPSPGPAPRRAPSAAELETRRTKALDYCDAQIAFFTDAAKKAYRLYRASQVITIVLSAITPILVLSDAIPISESQRLLIAAVLSAMVAVVTGLSGVFHWQEEWIRSASYRERLTAERHRFETAATAEYQGDDEQEAIAAFVRATEALRLADADEWKAAAKSQGASWATTEEKLVAGMTHPASPGKTT